MLGISENDCLGCTACYSICPVDAIKMKPNFEGFLYPFVDKDLCIACGKCETVCPLNYNYSSIGDAYECVIAQSNDDVTLRECTSGGFIDALCQYITCLAGGWVAGVAYDENFQPVHKIVNSYADAIKFRNSKYAQSDLKDTFRRIRELVRKNELVMFVGTPCQVGGLKSFLGRDFENLITVDLVCRSIPSPELWRQYLLWQKRRYGSDIEQVFCRKKTYGYHTGALEIEFKNGKCYRASNRVDYYMKAFHSDISSRLSCYRCPFKMEERVSDFTVFDSWNPEEVAKEKLIDNDRGYSNIIVRTDKAKQILKRMHNVVIWEAHKDKIFSFTGGMEKKSIRLTDERKQFYFDLDEVGFEKTAKKYVSVKCMDYVIEFLRPYKKLLRRLIRGKKIQ